MKDNKDTTKKDEKKQPENNENKENIPENEKNNEDPAKNEENKEENPAVEEKGEQKQSFNPDLKCEDIYTEEKIKELIENKDKEKREEIISQLFIDFFKKRGDKIKSNQLKAILNFHTQNIEFILSKFSTYSIDIITKICKIFSLLLNLREEEYNPQLKSIEGAQEDIYKHIPEPDFCYIINKKLMEIKQCFIKFKLFPDPKSKSKEKEPNFYLTNEELNIIMKYLNDSYFPFIRLFYHVININRIETKKINSNAVKPLTIVNNNDIDNAPEKFIIEEQVKRPLEKEKKIDEKIEDIIENRFDVIDDIKNRQMEMGNKIRSDYVNEVRKLITEKVEELKKDVDAKISENGLEIERNFQNIKEQYMPANKKK